MAPHVSGILPNFCRQPQIDGARDSQPPRAAGSSNVGKPPSQHVAAGTDPALVTSVPSAAAIEVVVDVDAPAAVPTGGQDAAPVIDGGLVHAVDAPTPCPVPVSATADARQSAPDVVLVVPSPAVPAPASCPSLCETTTMADVHSLDTEALTRNSETAESEEAWTAKPAAAVADPNGFATHVAKTIVGPSNHYASG